LVSTTYLGNLKKLTVPNAPGKVHTNAFCVGEDLHTVVWRYSAACALLVYGDVNLPW